MANIGYKTIYEKAKIIKQRAENNHESVGTKWAYYICKSILTPRKNIKSLGTFGYAPKEHGDQFNNVKIYKKDYLDCAKRITMYVEKFKKLPNFVKWNGKLIKTRDYTYNMAKILVYYYTHKDTYPAYNTINTDIWKKPPAIKKYGRSRDYGCDERGQNNGHYCGPHMIQEIIRNLTGKVISQSTLAEVIGTTIDGSDHDGLNTSIAWFNKKYGYNLKVEWKNFSEVGWNGIKKILESNNQDCGLHELYRGTWGHYTNFDKVYSDYIDVHNSLGDYCSSGCYCGYTEERDKSEAEYYLGGISQKSVMVVTNAG